MGLCRDWSLEGHRLPVEHICDQIDRLDPRSVDLESDLYFIFCLVETFGEHGAHPPSSNRLVASVGLPSRNLTHFLVQDCWSRHSRSRLVDDLLGHHYISRAGQAFACELLSGWIELEV